MHTRIILSKIAYIFFGVASLWIFIENMASVSISPEMKDRSIAISIFFALLARIAQAQYHSDRAYVQAQPKPPSPPGLR